MSTSGSKTSASFWLVGDNLDPDFWTRFFGRNPSGAKVKGKHLYLRNGRVLPGLHPSGLWSYHAPNPPETCSIDEQVEYLANELGLPNSRFLELLKGKELSCRISVYVGNFDGQNPPKYTDRTTRIVEECNARLQIDIWDDRRMA